MGGIVYNWSVDTKELKKDKEKYTIWKIEQMVNYGLDGEKIDEKLVKKYWKKLHLDPFYKEYLKFLLWSKKKQF